MAGNPFEQAADRSHTNAEKYALRHKLFHTEEVLPMWVADMDIETPQCVRDAVIRRAQHPVYGYEMMPDSAFAAQIAWMQRRHGLALEREWMFFSHSVVASIGAAVAAFSEPGDGVIIQPPVYFPFFSAVRHLGRSAVTNPLKQDAKGDYTFDLDDLRSKIDKNTKLLLLCSPHNPVGRVWRRDELEAIADICLEHGIRVFADEIHSDLVYPGRSHIPFAALSDAARAITVTAIGPGKTFNVAGLAASTVAIADAQMRERFREIYNGIHFAEGTVFGHAGFEAAYRGGEAWLEALLVHLKTNAIRLQTLLSAFDTVAFTPPQGTYLGWLDCRGMGFGSDKALREFFIREAGLGLSPGISFSKEGSGFMRLNFAVPTETMDEALYRLERALSRR